MFKNKDGKLYNTYLAYFVAMVFFVIARIVVNVGLLSNLPRDVRSYIYTIIIQVGVMFLIPFGVYALLNRKDKDYKAIKSNTNLKKINTKTVFISIGLGISMVVVGYAVAMIFNSFLIMFGYNFSSGGSSSTAMFSGTWSLVLDIIFVAVFPAIFEELLHRGLVLTQTKKLGVKKSIIISSLLFGLVHFNIEQFFYAFVLGMLLASVTLLTKSIVPAMIMHFLNNAINVVVSHKGVSLWQMMESLQTSLNLSEDMTMFITLLLFGAILSMGVKLMAMLINDNGLWTLKQQKKLGQSLNEFFNDKNLDNFSDLDKLQTVKELLEKKSLEDKAKGKDGLFSYRDKASVKVYNQTTLDKVFLAGSITLGVVITFFTYLWGALW